MSYIGNNQMLFGARTADVIKSTISPVFAENSWETIAHVCRYGDPSKYWKVGDYKEVVFKEEEHFSIGDTTGNGIEEYLGIKCYDPSNMVDEIKGTSIKIGAEFTYTIGEDETIEYKIRLTATNRMSSAPTKIIYEEEKKLAHLTFPISFECGITIEQIKDGDINQYLVDATFTPYITTNIANHTSKMVQTLQIIGFNHDKVINPYEYGKQRAGMTLQLGCSRNVTGDEKATLLEPLYNNIEGIITEDKLYFKCPNNVLTDYTEGATNWVDGGFRIALQSLFDKSEIAPFLVEVQKYTSQYFDTSNKWYAPMLSSDKVFLLSEYEVFGEVFRAPGKEGEHYEFYKDGYSKFMWSNGLLFEVINGARIWLRSAYGEGVSPSTKNINYAISIYESVVNRNPLRVNYMPSKPSNGKDGVPAYIAPCICL